MRPQQIEAARAVVNAALDLAARFDIVYVTLRNRHGNRVVYHYEQLCLARVGTRRVLTTLASLRELNPECEPCARCVERGSSE